MACELSDETLQTLRLSALQVDSAMNNAVGQTDGRAGERAGGQVGEPVGGEGAGRCENTGASLLRCAQLLVPTAISCLTCLERRRRMRRQRGACEGREDSCIRSSERHLAAGARRHDGRAWRPHLLAWAGASDTERSVSGRATGHAVPCLGGTVHHGRCE